MKVKITPDFIAFNTSDDCAPTNLSSEDMGIENFDYIEDIVITLIENGKTESERNYVRLGLDDEQAEMLAHTLLLMVEQNRRQQAAVNHK